MSVLLLLDTRLTPFWTFNGERCWMMLLLLSRDN